jgi:hypothetical protein
MLRRGRCQGNYAIHVNYIMPLLKYFPRGCGPRDPARFWDESRYNAVYKASMVRPARNEADAQGEKWPDCVAVLA